MTMFNFSFTKPSCLFGLFVAWCCLLSACTSGSSSAPPNPVSPAPSPPASVQPNDTKQAVLNESAHHISGDFQQAIERLVARTDFAPIPSSKWNYGYRPPKRSTEDVVFVDETNHLHEGLKAYPTMASTELLVHEINSVVLKRKTTASTKPDLKITEFIFQNNPPNEKDKASLKAISTYIFSSRSTIKHPNWIVYVNGKGYIFETRAMTFEKQTRKMMQLFEGFF